MNKPKLVISCPVATRSGYGDHSRDIIRSLLQIDKYDVSILSQRWGGCPMNALDATDDFHKEIIKRIVFNNNLTSQPDIWIQVSTPIEFQKVGKYNIGITAGIETTACSAEWLIGCNNMDLIIVPSEHSKRSLMSPEYRAVDQRTNNQVGNLKCEKPIEVIFEGVDLNKYGKDKLISTNVRHELNNNIKEDFCFLYVGHWLNGDLGEDRKNTGLLIKLFLETFKNESYPPALILKTSGATFSIIDRENILDKINKIKSTVQSEKSLPNVYLLHGDLTDEEMNSLYNHSKVKCHINLTKGEGFCRTLLESSLSEKPIIASNWSGHIDFLHKDYNALIGGELKPVHPSAVWDKMIIKESSWFSVNIHEVNSAMMSIYKNYQYFKQKATLQLDYAKNNFNLDKMTEKFGEIFNKYIPEFPKQIQLNLPKLKKIELPKLKKIGEELLEEEKKSELKLPKLKKIE